MSDLDKETNGKTNKETNMENRVTNKMDTLDNFVSAAKVERLTNNSKTPVPPNRRRKFSELSSPVSPGSDDITSNPPSEARMVQLLQDALKPIQVQSKSIQDKLEELIASHELSESEHEYFHTSINLLKAENKDMQERMTHMEQENKILKERLIHQESHSRRNNLRFHGLPESKFDNAEEKVLHFLRSHGMNFHPRSIERAHRLGNYSSGRTRPVIVRFLHFKDREVIWRKMGHGLIPPAYNKPHVREDFPSEVEDARTKLLPIAVAATNFRDPSTKQKPRVQMVVDRLFINNKKYTKDGINTIPGKLNPREIFTPTKDDKTAFFTQNSPLSNHHPSPFKLHGEHYNCLEQFIMVQKARTFGDQNAVVNIMKESLPSRQKHIGKTILGFEKQEWEKVAQEKILPGMMAKFQQNEACRKMLLSTGENQLIEANPHDLFFGAGVSLRSIDLWQTSKHPGKNIMGKMLHRVREKLKEIGDDSMDYQEHPQPPGQ